MEVSYKNNCKVNINDVRFGAELATRSLLYEVCITPKPGLVDCANSGIHNDMDIFTFVSSSCALFSCFEDFIKCGRSTATSTPKTTMSKLRKIGIKAEKKMFKATNGINTHKGAIFSLGLVCGALGRLPKTQWNNPKKILNECKKMTKGIVKEELENISKSQATMTNGEKLYKEYGITGIRGQAESGFPIVISVGLPILHDALKKGYSLNEAGYSVLLNFITILDDTCIVSKQNHAMRKKLITEISDELKKADVVSADKVNQFNEKFIDNSFSPGGCADMLALTLFLYFLETESGNQCI